ncbi:MAG TPA: HAD family hydrolase [Phycisphaerae bacterium]|nr:HAD family hydrolase [Phycisphaerae bacterium]
MKYEGVIFDLFGTLVPSVTPELYNASLRKTAEAVGADFEAFHGVWADKEMVRRRMTGAYASQAEAVLDVSRRLGLSPAPQALRRAAELRAEGVRMWIRPRPDAVGVLERLRSAGLKLGMMSVCSADTPIAWVDTPLAGRFDAELFSCVEGLTKPDPRFYARTCERLGVQLPGILYVGDGFDRELTGAREFGLDAVLICPPDEESIILAREDARTWSGRRIASLSEVANIVGC